MNKLEIAWELKKYRDNKNLSLQKMEKETGISYATISNIINGKHDQISDDMFRRISSFLKLDNWKPMDTNNYAMIHELLGEAQEYQRFFAIVGNSGFGKTVALDGYRKQHPNCFYMLCDVLMSSKRGFLMSLQRAMGLREGSNASDMLGAIVNRLNSLDKPLLILDDAGKLNDANMRLIQLLYDRTERHAGIVIAGTPYLKDMLENGITRNKMGFDELFRRVEYWLHLFAPTKPEVIAMCEYHGLKEQKGVVSAIVNSCRNFGAVRSKITLACRLQQKGKLTEQSMVDMVEHQEPAKQAA